jgi:hypothetical protein
MRFHDARRPFDGNGSALHFLPNERADVPKHIHTFSAATAVRGNCRTPNVSPVTCQHAVRTPSTKEQPTEIKGLSLASMAIGAVENHRFGWISATMHPE